MKMRTYRLVLLSACFAVSAAACAQRYGLAGVKAGRVEVTSRFDARPDSAALRVVEPYRKAVDSIMSPVLGESEVAMSVRLLGARSPYSARGARSPCSGAAAFR